MDHEDFACQSNLLVLLNLLTLTIFYYENRYIRVLLNCLLNKHNFQCIYELNKELDAISAKSKTAQLWIDCLIKPVVIIMKYIRAEREADWALHLDTVKEIIPLFFAAGHTHYARYALYYPAYNGNSPY